MKNVVITGTSSGIGQAIAECLSRNGYHVFGSSRNPNCTDQTIRTYQLDVRDDASVARFMRQVTEEVDRIDVLVNNAGYGISGPIEETSMEEAKEQFEVNFFGVLRMTRAVLPAMRANGDGMIINMSSVGGLIGMPFQGHYSASKFALEGLTEALRLELRPFNIKVFNINPADFSTPFTDNRKKPEVISEAYRTAFERMLSIYEHDERNGPNPTVIARLVKSLIERDGGHRIRYVVGRRSQTMAVHLKRILGDSVFERLMKRAYRLK